MNTTIIDAAQALAGLLRAAEEGGLPLPTSAEASNYAPHGSSEYDDERHGDGGITFLVGDLSDLTEWAVWFDAAIEDNGEPYKGNMHRHVHGHAGPFPVRVTALVPVEQGVPA